MALTYDELVSILTPSAGTLNVEGARLGTDPVTAMFQYFFDSATLQLTSAVSSSDEPSQTVTVTGAVVPNTVLNLDQAKLYTSAWQLQQDGSVTVKLAIAPTNPDWELSLSFTLLKGSVFEDVDYANAVFTLDSTASTVLDEDFRASFGYAGDLPVVTDGLIRYLSLTIDVNFKADRPGQALTTLFTQPLTLSGPIEIYSLLNPFGPDGPADSPIPQAYPQMCLSLISGSAKPVSVGDQTFAFTLQMASPLVEFQSQGEVGLIVASALAVRTSINIGGTDIPLAALLYPSQMTEIYLYAGRIPDGPVVGTEDIPSMFGSANVGELLETVPGFPLFNSVQIQGVSFVFSMQESLSFLQASVTVAAIYPVPTSWEVFGGLFTVEQIGLSLTVDNTLDVGGTIFGSAKLGGDTNDVTLAATFQLWDLNFVCNLSENAQIDIGGMLNEYFGMNMDWTVDAATFQLSGSLKQMYFSFQGAITQSWTIFGTEENGLTLGNIYPHLGARIVTDSTTNKSTTVVNGGLTANLTLAGAELTVSAAYTTDEGWTFEGRSAPGQGINLTALVVSVLELFGVDVAEDLTSKLPVVDLTQLMLKYNTLSGNLSAFGAVQTDFLSFNLTSIPLIGPYLDPADTISVRNLQFLVSSTTNPQTKVKTNLIAATVVVGFGTTDSITLQIPIYGTLPPPPPGSTRPYQPPPTSYPQSTGSNPGMVTYPTTGTGIWIPVQKTFGPLQVQKIGFSLSLDGFEVQMNCAVKVAGLTVTAYGLGLTISLFSSFDVHPELAGIGVMLKWDPLDFNGTLLWYQDGQYDGSIAVTFGRLGFSALGSYATTDPPSFFLFAMLDFPLGGIPSFFVRGLSAGFGFNRSLTLPPLSQVASYPLVLGATPGPSNPFGVNPTINNFTDAMDQYMAVSIGEYWGAAGLRFTTYGTLDSYALATLAFGTQFQIGLLGMSTLVMPPKPGEGEVLAGPVAYAQLALEAVITPAEGEFQVSAQLTPTSYILSKKCQITGGFAFYLWFPPSEYAWQFVVTLGGYNPYFQRPSYYPSVPLLGVTIWLGIISIKGGLYFAVTSHAAMMGLSINSTWKSGPLKAWFNLSVDFLVQWKPFYYDVQAGATIGFSGTFKIAIVRVSINVSAGITFHMWGPDFSYSANIDLLMFSFSISGGSASQTQPAPLTWDEFQSAFLPTADSTSPAESEKRVARMNVKKMNAAAQPASSGGILTMQIAQGILKDLSGKSQTIGYVVDPQHFELTTLSQIPSKTIVVNQVSQSPSWTTDFGIGPMSVSVDDFASTHSIEVLRNNQRFDGLKFTPTLAPAPKALWMPGENLNSTLNQPSDIANVAMGVSLTANVPVPDRSLPISIGILLFQQEQAHTWTWDLNPEPSSDPRGWPDATAELTSTVNSPDIVPLRAAIIGDLMCNGTALSSAVNTGPLTNASTLNLLAPPVLSSLGENSALAS